VHLPDALWQLIAPLVARPRTTPKGGRPPKDQRSVVEAIVFVLQTGCPWKALLSTTFGVSPATAHRWHQRWSREGIWRKVHRVVLDHMQRHGVIAWERGVVDSSSVRSPGGAPKPAEILPIGVVPARSTTSSRTRGARLLRSPSRARTSATARRSSG
jgi:transposase